jgi:type III secretory pathway component EscU
MTLCVCFVLPLTGLLLLLGILLLGYLSPLAEFSQLGMEQVLGFLATFGGGSVWQGSLVIGLTVSVVGGLFDMFAFYKHQALRGFSGAIPDESSVKV